MTIKKIDLYSQRNAGHYQFLNDFNELVVKYTPQALDVVNLHLAFLLVLADELLALNAISKSASSDEIHSTDKNRDLTFRGLADKVKSALKHYNAEVREAAKRTMIIFDGYGNVAYKPNDEETALIKSLIFDLRSKVAADMELLQIVDWVAELERLNNYYVSLVSDRNSEVLVRTDLRMKTVRIESDNAYKAIVERINALIVVNGEGDYVEFVKELNARIKRAKDSLAQIRAGNSPATPEAL